MRMLCNTLSLVNSGDRKSNVNKRLFGNDTVLVVDSEAMLKQLVEESETVCRRRKVRVDQCKSKVMKCTKMVDDRKVDVALNGKLLVKIECCNVKGRMLLWMEG